MTQEFSRIYDSGGGSRDVPVSSGAGQINVLKFTGFPANAGTLLASLVASSTASRTSNIVTITATAHGITTGTTFVGYRFYYPGSPSLAAGWYDNILTIPDANTITFSANGADFSSESINSGSAWTSYVDIVTTTLSGGTLRDGSSVTLFVARDGGATAAFKYIQLSLGGGNAGINAFTTMPKSIYRASLVCIRTNKQYVTQANTDNVGTTALYPLTKDITTDLVVAIRGSVTAAGDFLVLNNVRLEVVR